MKYALPEIKGVTHQYLEIKGTRLHIAIAGKGRPLLFLHGWPQHWYVWRKLIPQLSNKYKLIMPDLPGLGWSEPEKNNDYRKENLAEYMIKLLDELNLRQAGLVGHDWGGWIGFLACLKAPERFSKYLALGITYPFGITHLPLSQYQRFFYQIPLALPFVGENLLHYLPSLTVWLIKKGTYKKDLWTKEELHWFSSVLQNPQKAKASSLLYRDFLNKELLSLYQGKYKNQKLQVLTRLLIGQYDPIINPSLFKNFKNPTNNITLEIIKDCGHFISEEKPELVAKEIKFFFSS